MILVIYAGYIFLAINISQNANVFSVITCIFAILLSGCIEDFSERISATDSGTGF